MIKLKIKKERYPYKKKDGSQTEKFYLRGSLNGRGFHRSWHDTKRAAEEKQQILIADYYDSNRVDDSEKEKVRLALDELKNQNINPDAKGKDIHFAVQWFTQNYRKTAEVKTVIEYIEEYIDLRIDRSDRTKKEDKFYLNHFKKYFGARKPTDISADQLKSYIRQNSCKYHRFKVIKTFFAWLSNSSKRMPKLQKPPLEKSPFIYLNSPTQKRKTKPLICSNDDVKNLIQEAIKEGIGTYVIWGLFTGKRPEAEIQPFWKNSKYGWKFVDLDRNTILVDDTLEKTGTRTREIDIQPNLREWIEVFKSDPEKYPMNPKNLRRKLREIKLQVLSKDKADEHDIMRHTFISNLSRVEHLDFVAVQCATSVNVIKKNYLRLVKNEEAKEFFNIGPMDFGLV